MHLLLRLGPSLDLGLSILPLQCELSLYIEHILLILRQGLSGHLSGRFLLDLLGLDFGHEFLHVRVLVNEGHMFRPQHFFQIKFSLICLGQDVVSLLGLELVLVKVSLDYAMADLLELE